MRSIQGISTISIYNCALDDCLHESASAGVIFSITEPPPHPTSLMLSAVTSLIFQKKWACVNRGAALHSSPFHLFRRWCWDAERPAVGAHPEDVRRGGKVKHLAYMFIMCSTPQNRPMFPRAQCLEKRWLTFAPVRRILNDGRQAEMNWEKIASLNHAAEGGEKERGWFLIPSRYCCLSGPYFPSFFFPAHTDKSVHARRER